MLTLPDHQHSTRKRDAKSVDRPTVRNTSVSADSSSQLRFVTHSNADLVLNRSIQVEPNQSNRSIKQLRLEKSMSRSIKLYELHKEIAEKKEMMVRQVEEERQ